MDTVGSLTDIVEDDARARGSRLLKLDSALEGGPLDELGVSVVVADRHRATRDQPLLQERQLQPAYVGDQEPDRLAGGYRLGDRIMQAEVV